VLDCSIAEYDITVLEVNDLVDTLMERWVEVFRTEFKLDLRTLQNADLAKSARWQEFASTHLERTELMVRFFQCGQRETCSFCRRARVLTLDQRNWWFGNNDRDIKLPWHFPGPDPHMTSRSQSARL